MCESLCVSLPLFPFYTSTCFVSRCSLWYNAFIFTTSSSKASVREGRNCSPLNSSTGYANEFNKFSFTGYQMYFLLKTNPWNKTRFESQLYLTFFFIFRFVRGSYQLAMTLFTIKYYQETVLKTFFFSAQSFFLKKKKKVFKPWVSSVFLFLFCYDSISTVFPINFSQLLFFTFKRWSWYTIIFPAAYFFFQCFKYCFGIHMYCLHDVFWHVLFKRGKSRNWSARKKKYCKSQKFYMLGSFSFSFFFYFLFSISEPPSV